MVCTLCHIFMKRALLMFQRESYWEKTFVYQLMDNDGSLRSRCVVVKSKYEVKPNHLYVRCFKKWFRFNLIREKKPIFWQNVLIFYHNAINGIQFLLNGDLMSFYRTTLVEICHHIFVPLCRHFENSCSDLSFSTWVVAETL